MNHKEEHTNVHAFGYTKSYVFWLHNKKEKHGNSLFEFTKNLMINRWSVETIIFPNHKDVIKRRTRVKLYESHATHYLQVSHVHILPSQFWHISKLFIHGF